MTAGQAFVESSRRHRRCSSWGRSYGHAAVTLARVVGWRTVVVDGRPRFATASASDADTEDRHPIEIVGAMPLIEHGLVLVARLVRCRC
jgi:hypothetical protein